MHLDHLDAHDLCDYVPETLVWSMNFADNHSHAAYGLWDFTSDE